MAKIRLNKLDAARRQINAAIRMLFAGEDPVAIHTVAMAAYGIVQDLIAQKDGLEFGRRIEDLIKPGKEKEFWRAIKAPANFLKHADRDADAILGNVEEEVNDFILLMAAANYQDLGNQWTPEMMALSYWVIARKPDLIKHDGLPADFLNALEGASVMKEVDRKDQLFHGREMLRLAREQATLRGGRRGRYGL